MEKRFWGVMLAASLPCGWRSSAASAVKSCSLQDSPKPLGTELTRSFPALLITESSCRSFFPCAALRGALASGSGAALRSQRPRLTGINPPWVGYKSRGAQFGVWWSTLRVYLDQILHASAFVWSAGGNHVRWEPGQRA